MFLALQFMFEPPRWRFLWPLLITQIVINVAMLAVQAETLGSLGPDSLPGGQLDSCLELLPGLWSLTGMPARFIHVDRHMPLPLAPDWRQEAPEGWQKRIHHCRLCQSS